MDDLIGHAFALVFADGFMPQTQLQQISTQYPLLKCVSLVANSAQSLLERYEAKAVLLRPDRYVHAVVATPDEIGDILRELPVRMEVS